MFQSSDENFNENWFFLYFPKSLRKWSSSYQTSSQALLNNIFEVWKCRTIILKSLKTCLIAKMRVTCAHTYVIAREYMTHLSFMSQSGVDQLSTTEGNNSLSAWEPVWQLDVSPNALIWNLLNKNYCTQKIVKFMHFGTNLVVRRVLRSL